MVHPSIPAYQSGVRRTAVAENVTPLVPYRKRDRRESLRTPDHATPATRCFGDVSPIVILGVHQALL